MPRVTFRPMPSNDGNSHGVQRSPGIAGGEYRYPGAGARLASSSPDPTHPRRAPDGMSGPFEPARLTPSPMSGRTGTPSPSGPDSLPTTPSTIRETPSPRVQTPQDQPDRENMANTSLDVTERRPTVNGEARMSPLPGMTSRDLLVTHPINGCLVLGKYPRGPAFANYFTRYWIDRKVQREAITLGVLFDGFVPCCSMRNWTSYSRATWAFFRSDAFLLFLHIVVIVLGASKEALDYRQTSHSEDGVLHMLLSVLECFLANLQITLRSLAVWTNFKSIKGDIRGIEYLSRPASARGRGLRTGVGFFIVFFVLLVMGNIACFVVLYMYYHLGWTIISNAVAMLIVMDVAYLFNQRIDKIKVIIAKDHHKVALYESVLLLRESFVLRGRDRLDYYDRADKFLHCFSQTPEFDKPTYIHLLKDHVIEWDNYLPEEPVTIV